MTFGDRFRGGLWGLFVGDALAMPVHWYYDVAALQRDFGTIRDYRAPKDFHPNSIISPARSLSDLSFNYLIFSKLIFLAIFQKQAKSVCYSLSPTGS